MSVKNQTKGDMISILQANGSVAGLAPAIQRRSFLFNFSIQVTALPEFCLSFCIAVFSKSSAHILCVPLILFMPNKKISH